MINIYDMSDFYNSLNEPQKEFFDHYKSNDYYFDSEHFATALNEKLRNGIVSADWQTAINILDEIILKHQLTQEQTVYRVTSLEIINAFRSCNEISYPAFLSTATDLPSVRTHFKTLNTWDTPVIMKIICPEETHIAPFENDTSSGMEKEMLLGRNQKLTIINEEIVTDRPKIEQYMDRDLAIDFDQLHLVTIKLVV